MNTKLPFISHWNLLSPFLQRALQVLGLAIVWTYRLLLSPWLGGQCRFTPSCSCYAEEALRVHPPGKAFQLILFRLSQCRPGGHYGLDPVPSRLSKANQQ